MSLNSSAILAGSAKYPKPAGYEYSFGTAGFRTKATLLPCALYRTGLLSVLRSKKLLGKTIGIMITASHNPPQDNGVKLVDPRGEMLESSWEVHAAALANTPDDQLVTAVQHLVDSLKIDLKVKAKVVFGRDTRPSGEALNEALKDGLRAMGLEEEEIQLGNGEKGGDVGVVTTPVLHYLVRCLNTVGKGGVEEYGKPTVEGYYQKMAGAFRKLTESKSPISTPILVDCANGVGATALSQFLPFLTSSSSSKPPSITLTPVSTSTSTPSLLNHNSGADYVKTNQKLPPVLLPPSASALVPGRLACSFDGDADRIIFYYLEQKTGEFRLLDGDKQAALAAGFFVDLVKQAGLDGGKGASGSEREEEEEEEDGPGEGAGEREGGVEVGVVQTAYANGSSTRYLKERLPVTCVPTGVKHLHHAAERYSIGVYFEANGHGTVLFSPSFLLLLQTHQPSTPAQATALSHLTQLSLLVNQAIGDALSDLLLILTILLHRGWGPREWDASYQDLPNRLVKVLVRDRTVFRTEDAERRLVSPRGVQEKIEEETRKYEGGRAFVRPSGTEDCVRVYAEAVSGSHAEELALRVSQIVEEASAQQ